MKTTPHTAARLCVSRDEWHAAQIALRLIRAGYWFTLEPHTLGRFDVSVRADQVHEIVLAGGAL